MQNCQEVLNYTWRCGRDYDSPIYLHITAPHMFLPTPITLHNKLRNTLLMRCISCQNSSSAKGGRCDVDCKTQVQNRGGTRLASVATTQRNLREAQRGSCSFWSKHSPMSNWKCTQTKKVKRSLWPYLIGTLYPRLSRSQSEEERKQCYR